MNVFGLLRALWRWWPARIGLVLLLGFVLVGVGGERLAPYPPEQLAGRPFAPPSREHWLGTNDIGQDLLSELIVGARSSLLVGILSATLATTLGLVVGLLAGYYRGAIDTILMRIVDILLVVPFLPLAVVLAAYLGPSLLTLTLVIGLVTWSRPARLIRAHVLTLQSQEYVLAAHALGVTSLGILRRHLLPGTLTLALIQFILGTSQAILIEAALSFLGLGDPTTASWGSMLYYAQARSAFLTGAWPWWVVPPGASIAILVLSLALVGVGLEARLNPAARNRSASSVR
ncbi:MAG: ABC transporter permease [Blastochloris sp.]|nr:ABC transporter permease [Blastochloris sp.]